MKEKIKVPASKESTAGKETVEAAPNQGNECCAQPVVDAGVDSGVGAWVGDGKNVRFVKADAEGNVSL
jgi:hypothetical protein